MTDSRPPGDTRPRTRLRSFRWEYWTPESDGSKSLLGEYFYSVRPSYPKGNVITLPGGVSFRQSTNYEHFSWELGNYAPFEVSGYRSEPYDARNYRKSVDEREVSFITWYGWKRKAEICDPIPSDARNEVVTKALNKIADQKVNLGENLATLRQTASLLATKGKALADALHAIKRKREFQRYLNKTARDILREGPLNAVSRLYLEYIYGLKPLVSDVYELVQYCKQTGQKTLLLKASASAQRNVGVKSPSAWDGLSYSGYRLLSANANTKVKCTLWARIDPDYSGLRSLNQLGLLNPLGLAWDLVPYSFVVDWFLPVGPVLYALSAPAGLIFVDGSISGRISQLSTFEYVTSTISIPYPLQRTVSETSCIVPHNYEGYVRNRLSDWPRPGLWLDPDPLRVDRPFKALALSILALSGTRPPVR